MVSFRPSFGALFLTALFFAPAPALQAQSADTSYLREIELHRKQYLLQFLAVEPSPLKEDALNRIRFFPPDPRYRVRCRFEPLSEAAPLRLPTFDGREEWFLPYGTLTFELEGRTHRLIVFQSFRMRHVPGLRERLFLPFRDRTNGRSTYPGGRYLDLLTSDIQDGTVWLDFNLAYNPWCAYDERFTCPIPPKSNHLDVEIRAGEMKFEK
ncbi:MAG: DUF1684 domain-containing protein [Bacteroidetes bacterium]|nr:MAG: DUF1684 domain-containing protein [Bacteroidota bacterium]